VVFQAQVRKKQDNEKNNFQTWQSNSARRSEPISDSFKGTLTTFELPSLKGID